MKTKMSDADKKKVLGVTEALGHLKGVLDDPKFRSYLDMAIRRAEMVVNGGRRKV
jgi:hypothetical protein